MKKVQRIGTAADYDMVNLERDFTMTIGKTVFPFLVSLVAGSMAGLGLGACDLPPKNIGDSDSAGGGGGSGDTGGSSCEGPAPDIQCATCQCADGNWVCPAIGCVDTGGPGGSGTSDGGGVCMPGDQVPADDGCNTCTCQDDGMTWACTLLGCQDPPVCQDGDTMDAGDGCNTCSCSDGQWACTEKNCPPAAIPVCNGTEPADAFVINTASIDGDALALNVSYSGGCAQHVFDLCWGGGWEFSDPVQTNITVTHDGMNDTCEAYPSEDIALDLSGLREEYVANYGTDSATIVIHLDGWGSTLDYSF